jgi:hypothetical protein
MKRVLLLCSSLILNHLIFAQWTTSGSNIYNSNTGNVGIGLTNPTVPLDVNGVMRTRSGLIAYGASTGGISPGNLAAYLLGPSGGDANVIIQGNSGSDVAFWLTGAPQYLMIGGQGGSEPAKGAINIDYTGHVGINTTNTSGFNFSVNGTAVFDQVTVEAFSSTNPNGSPWADYVFDKGYQLPSIYSLADYIKANNHLPGIPTSAEVKKNGLDLGATQAKLLEKIEQLTLYTIDLQHQADDLRKQVETLKEENRKTAELQAEIDAIKASIAASASSTH